MIKMNKDKGQGLVEMALLLPFLLVLLVGLVELGVALNRQIVVVNAAREGARFGAAGGSLGDIHAETRLATSQMIEFDEENAVIIVVQAEVNGAGDGFAEWQELARPEGATAPHVTQAMILQELGEEGDPAGVGAVIVDIEYDHEAILGLPFVSALMGRIPIGSWTVMRLESLESPRELPCCIYPIALDVEAVGAEMEDIRIGEGAGMFGWLYWDPDENGNAGYLEANIHDPCVGVAGFKNACDPKDTTLDVGDWVSGDSGESVSKGVRTEVEKRVGQYIRIPLWDRFAACGEMSCGCQPGSQAAHIVGFIIVEVTEVNLTASPKTISATFVRIDDGCQTR